MIITTQAAKKLVKNNLAVERGITYDSNTDKSYMVVDNLQKHRTDHYFLGFGDLRESN